MPLSLAEHLYHANGFAGSHMVIVGVPPLEFWILSMFQDVLLALKVWVVKADPCAALHTDRVHPENVTGVKVHVTHHQNQTRT